MRLEEVSLGSFRAAGRVSSPAQLTTHESSEAAFEHLPSTRLQRRVQQVRSCLETNDMSLILTFNPLYNYIFVINHEPYWQCFIDFTRKNRFNHRFSSSDVRGSTFVDSLRMMLLVLANSKH